MYVTLVRKWMSLMLCLTALLYGNTFTVEPAEPAAEGAVRAVTFNLRCTGVGKTSVAYRAPRMAAQLLSTDADSMGFQEANLRWMTYLQEQLTDYDYVGVARENGRNLGEFSPIFYKKDKYTLRDSGTFWLSKTPDKPGSKDWGSQNVRICTWAILENKENGKVYAHFNTHLDHISGTAREMQMQVLLEKIGEYAAGLPVVLTGDFNDDCASAMYQKATAVLRDTRILAPVTEDKATFHNYGGVVLMDKIDFVFVSEGITPLVYHVIDDKVNGEYLSDHYGIYVDLTL